VCVCLFVCVCVCVCVLSPTLSFLMSEPPEMLNRDKRGVRVGDPEILGYTDPLFQFSQESEREKKRENVAEKTDSHSETVVERQSGREHERHRG